MQSRKPPGAEYHVRQTLPSHLQPWNPKSARQPYPPFGTPCCALGKLNNPSIPCIKSALLGPRASFSLSTVPVQADAILVVCKEGYKWRQERTTSLLTPSPSALAFGYEANIVGGAVDGSICRSSGSSSCVEWLYISQREGNTAVYRNAMLNALGMRSCCFIGSLCGRGARTLGRCWADLGEETLGRGSAESALGFARPLDRVFSVRLLL